MTHISSKSRPYFSHLNLGINMKIQTTPHLILIIAADPPLSLLDFFHIFWTFCILNAWEGLKIISGRFHLVGLGWGGGSATADFPLRKKN